MAQVPINKKALSWAIQSSGIPEDDIDGYCKFAPGTIKDWINGQKQPNKTQFKTLTSKLRRPAAVFFMENPPATSETSVEFRATVGDIKRTMPPKARQSIRDAIRIQRLIKDLNYDLELNIPEYPTNSTNEDAERVADHIREVYFDVSIELQMSWSTDANAFKNWRTLIEKLGILVFLYPIGKNPDLQNDDANQDNELDYVNSVKGFSNTLVLPPVVGVNTYWNYSVRSYTLFHELGHILTRTSSACTESSSKVQNLLKKDRIERWCESFAAAFLMPRQEFLKINNNINFKDPITRAGSIAKKLFVSRKAALIRLIELNLADWEDYKKLQSKYDRKPRFMRPNPENVQIRTRDVQVKDRYGNCLSIVHRAYQEGLISEIDVMDYFNVSPKELL